MDLTDDFGVEQITCNERSINREIDSHRLGRNQTLPIIVELLLLKCEKLIATIELS